jgi:hypothetical protein
MDHMDPRVRIAVFLISIVLLVFILRMVKNRKIWERYAILWVGLGFVVVAFSLFVNTFDILLDKLGVDYQPAFYLLIAVVSILLILLQCTVEITTLVRQNRDAVQELAILKERVLEMEKKMLEGRIGGSGSG